MGQTRNQTAPGVRKEMMVTQAPPGPAVRRELPPSRQVKLAAAGRYSLGALRLDELARLDSHAGPPRTGVHRPVAEAVLRQGTWADLAGGGRLWRLALASPGSSGLRVHFQGFDVGAGRVWIHDGADQVEGPYSGQGIFDDGDFWTGIVFSSSLVIEYQPAAAAIVSDTPPFRIAAISHQAAGGARCGAGREGARFGRLEDDPGLAAPFEPEAGTPDPAAGCHLDPNCFPEWGDSMKSVAEIVFETPDGYQAACSGALLATRDNSLKPYFLTADRCINDDSAARSLAAYFSYQTASCGGAPPTTRGPSILGSTLLFHASMDRFDATLLLLSSAPAGAAFAGWDTAEPPIGNTVAGIHHPMASWKRISIGTRQPDTDQIVGDTLAPADGFVQVTWDKGRAEPGSLGSPLFSGPGVVVGDLSYGLFSDTESVCDMPGEAGYGRFADLYPFVLNYLEDLPDARVTSSVSQLAFTGRNGAVNGSSTQPLPLRTQSASPVAYSASSDSVWLNVSPISGLVSKAAPATLQVLVNPKTLTRAGTYLGRVSISSASAAADPAQTPQQVLVRFDMVIDRSKVVASISPNPVVAQAQPDGPVWVLELKLAETAGVATRITNLLVNGADYSSSIVPWFGSNRLGAFGTAQVQLTYRNLFVPTDRYFEVDGKDEASGQPWHVTVAVRLLPQP